MKILTIALFAAGLAVSCTKQETAPKRDVVRQIVGSDNFVLTEKAGGKRLTFSSVEAAAGFFKKYYAVEAVPLSGIAKNFKNVQAKAAPDNNGEPPVPDPNDYDVDWGSFTSSEAILNYYYNPNTSTVSLNTWYTLSGYRVTFSYGYDEKGQLFANNGASSLTGWTPMLTWISSGFDGSFSVNGDNINFTIVGTDRYSVSILGIDYNWDQPMTIKGSYNVKTGAYHVTKYPDGK